MSLFLGESFTLKDLCSFFIKNSLKLVNKIDKIDLSEILFISDMYLSFSNGTDLYKKNINNLRNSKGCIYIDKNNGKSIYFREILQIFDIEFTKLIIRIKTESKKYDINVMWCDIENKCGIKKCYLQNLFS